MFIVSIIEAIGLAGVLLSENRKGPKVSIFRLQTNRRTNSFRKDTFWK